MKRIKKTSWAAGELESFFKAGRESEPKPPKGLRDRALADARRIQRAFGQRPGRMGALAEALSLPGLFAGLPVAAGLAACALAGFGLGLANSELIAEYASLYTPVQAFDAADMMPDISELLEA